MHNWIKQAPAVLGFLICLAAAVLLPSLLAMVEDQSLTKEIYHVELEEAFLISTAHMDIIDKLDLLESADESDFISVSAGSNLTIYTVDSVAEAQLTELMNRSLIPTFHPEWFTHRDIDYDIYFVVKPSNPDQNTIIWVKYFFSDTFTGTIYIDDETGLILKCFIIANSDEDSLTPLSPEAWAQAWADYLGLSLQNMVENGRPFRFVATYDAGGNRTSVSLECLPAQLQFGTNGFFTMVKYDILI